MIIQLNKCSASNVYKSIEVMVLMNSDNQVHAYVVKGNYVLNATWLTVSNSINCNVHLNFRDIYMLKNMICVEFLLCIQ